MSEKPRKFTNGYYPSYNSNCNDKSDVENSPSDHSLRFDKHSEKNVTDRTDRLKIKWNKLKNRGKCKNLNLELIKSLKRDVEQEIGYLDDWMKENDEKIKEVKIYRVARWSSRKKIEKLSNYKDILTDIEVHGKLLKVFQSIYKELFEDDLIDDDDQAMKRVTSLETVWHGVWLRAMEWECAIEQSLARRVDKVGDSGTNFEVESEDDILRTITEKEDSEINVTKVKGRSEPEQFLRNPRCPSITSCHMSKSPPSEITKYSQICDSDCLSSDSGFSDLSYEFPTCLVRNIPPMCPTQIQKVTRTTSTNLQKHEREKQKKKHKRTLEKTNIGCCRQILSLIFLMSILLLICNIKCYNNTCAIYVNTHLMYYRGPPPI